MGRNSLNIEVAGLCGQVNLENERLLSYLETRAGNFLSRQEPDFFVDVVPTPLLGIDENILIPAVSEGSVNAKVVREGDLFPVLIEINHNTRALAPIKIGSIDARRNRCRLNNYSEDLTRWLIMAFFRTCVQLFLGRSNGFMLHAGGLAKRGKGYIFAGPSGSGKSTVVEQSNGLTVLSDDFICVRNQQDRYYAYGTPWHGDDKNESAEIEKIFFLRHDRITRFERLSRGLAAWETLGNIPANIFDSELQTKVLDIVCGITATVPCYLMHFSLNEPFWERIESLD